MEREPRGSEIGVGQEWGQSEKWEWEWERDINKKRAAPVSN